MPEIVIVGASRGIGLEFVRQYAADGWRVHAICRKPADTASVQALGRTVTGHVADVTDETSLAAVASSFEAPIDTLIVNAGITAHEFKLADVVPRDWLRVMETNALGPMLAARVFAPRMRQPGSRVVALSSIMGSVGDNSGGAYWSYRMSKAALNMAMRNLAIELGSAGIIACPLHPGWVKTSMGGEGAQVEPEDSVRGLRRVIETLDMPKSGRFWDFRGEELPW